MFDATRNFLKRNRKSLAVGFGVASAGYIAVQYMGNKLSEARTRMMSERVAKENINRRFQQNQEDCTYTVLALLPTAAENIVRDLPVESLTQELQQKKAARIAKSAAVSTVSTVSNVGASTTLPSASVVPVREDDNQSLQSFASETFSAVPGRESAQAERPTRKTKIQLWDEIKISSLTRSFTLLYTLSLLTLLTRVQLNLLGRKNYLSSVLSLAGRNDDPTIRLESHDDEPTGGIINIETNRQYLTFSWWLLHRGWRLLSERVETATKQVFGPLTPRDTITLGRFRELAMEVRRIIETPGSNDASHNNEIAWLTFLLPPREEEPTVLAESGTFPSDAGPQHPSPELRRLLDETADLVESPMASTVLAHMLAVGFELLIDGKLAQWAFLPKAGSAQQPAATTTGEDSDASVVARVTPVVEDSAAAKFASVLAVLARQAHVIGNGSPNEYLAAMEKGTELEGFSALVYSSNFEFAAVQEQTV